MAVLFGIGFSSNFTDALRDETQPEIVRFRVMRK